MKEQTIIEGFSKLSKEEKIRKIGEFLDDPVFSVEVGSYWHPEKQTLFDQFSENTLTNFYMPFGIAPNFLINGKIFHVPMVIEESSVVAAAASAAKFWLKRGGFQARVISTLKKGHVHFLWNKDKVLLFSHFEKIKLKLFAGTLPLTSGMIGRGGGIRHITLEDYTDKLPGYFRLAVDFETADSMGANFINSVLETMAHSLKAYFEESVPEYLEDLEIIMSILSNHIPDCLVECKVQCSPEQLPDSKDTISGKELARRFKTAVEIANLDPFRAVTHNKGIMNGIDGVALATGNDFRAIEAGVHAYASSTGSYKSLSSVDLTAETFQLTLLLPLAVGTVGGLTSLHPMAKRALEILQNPSGNALMTIMASVGLANNFAALKALVTQGIQKGHMKMHLNNMINQFHLDENQKLIVEKYFKDRTLTYSAVKEYVMNKFHLTL